MTSTEEVQIDAVGVKTDECDDDGFWVVDDVLSTYFPPKCETINPVRYQETLKKLTAANILVVLNQRKY